MPTSVGSLAGKLRFKALALVLFYLSIEFLCKCREKTCYPLTQYSFFQKILGSYRLAEIFKSQPESLITLGTNLLWCDSSLYYRPWPRNTEIPVHGFLSFVIVVFVCPLKVMVCQAWYLLCRSLQQQIRSLFLTSSLGWHVKQDFFDTWFVLIMWQLMVALKLQWKAKMGGGRQLQTETVQELHRGFLCVPGVHYLGLS